MLKTLRNVLTGLLVLGFASTALAQDPEAGDVAPVEGSGEEEASVDDVGARTDGKPISVGLLLGYGISFEEGNPWGLGFGLRGGYNLDAIFLGGRFVYYLGEDNFNLWELGIEGGYDIPAGPVIIRPGIGLGIAHISIDIPDSVASVLMEEDISETNPYLAFGASVLYDIDEQFFIGGDGRIQIVIGDNGDGTALIILANGGMRF